MRRNQYIRGIQFTGLTLRQVDEMSRQRGLSRSELVRWLVRREAEKDRQPGLPGMDHGKKR